MKAQVLEAFGQPYVYRDVDKPGAPQQKDILVRVEAASYCHTDAVFASGSMWKDLPRIGSHEFAGEVVALGEEVDPELGVTVGQRIGVPGRAYRPCGTCEECRENDGDPESYGVWCSRAGNLGLSRNGGFAEYAVADSRQVAPIPEGLDPVNTAPLMCAGLTIWNALETAGINMNEPQANQRRTVAIIGAGGGLGHLGVQFAAKLGCKVIAVESGDKALGLLEDIARDSKEDGNEITIVDPRKEDAEDARRRVCGGPSGAGLEGELGADVAIILPEAQRAFEYGMKLLRNHSVCVTVSFPIDGFQMQPRDLVFRHIRVVGVLVGRNRQLRAMLEFAAKHGVRAKVTQYSLKDLNRLVEDYNGGASGKLVVVND